LREAHITCEANITPEGYITFRESGTHRSKTKSTSCEVLFVLRCVDKKDANLKMVKALIYQGFSELFELFFKVFSSLYDYL
jgi:hypothetical protein